MDLSHELPIVHQSLNIHITSKAITLSPSNKPHKYCLIFLHGFAQSIQHVLRAFVSPELLNLLSDFKIYIPQAPKRPSTLMGTDVFSWYDQEKEPTVSIYLISRILIFI